MACRHGLHTIPASAPYHYLQLHLQYNTHSILCIKGIKASSRRLHALCLDFSLSHSLSLSLSLSQRETLEGLEPLERDKMMAKL